LAGKFQIQKKKWIGKKNEKKKTKKKAMFSQPLSDMLGESRAPSARASRMTNRARPTSMSKGATTSSTTFRIHVDRIASSSSTTTTPRQQAALARRRERLLQRREAERQQSRRRSRDENGVRLYASLANLGGKDASTTAVTLSTPRRVANSGNLLSGTHDGGRRTPRRRVDAFQLAPSGPENDNTPVRAARQAADRTVTPLRENGSDAGNTPSAQEQSYADFLLSSPGMTPSKLSSKGDANNDPWKTIEQLSTVFAEKENINPTSPIGHSVYECQRQASGRPPRRQIRPPSLPNGSTVTTSESDKKSNRRRIKNNTFASFLEVATTTNNVEASSSSSSAPLFNDRAAQVKRKRTRRREPSARQSLKRATLLR
jgi:hypothetical protein